MLNRLIPGRPSCGLIYVTVATVTLNLSQMLKWEMDAVIQSPLLLLPTPPHDSRSACIAVIGGSSDPETDVASCRGLGAPLVFLYFPDQWQLWQQSTVKPKLPTPDSSRGDVELLSRTKGRACSRIYLSSENVGASRHKLSA